MFYLAINAGNPINYFDVKHLIILYDKCEKEFVFSGGEAWVGCNILITSVKLLHEMNVLSCL